MPIYFIPVLLFIWLSHGQIKAIIKEQASLLSFWYWRFVVDFWLEGHRDPFNETATKYWEAMKKGECAFYFVEIFNFVEIQSLVYIIHIIKMVQSFFNEILTLCSLCLKFEASAHAPFPNIC